MGFGDLVKKYVDNKYIKGLILLVVILYASFIAPKLNPTFVKIFDNTAVKIFFMFLLVFVHNHDPKVAILVTVALFFTMNVLAKKSVENKIKNVLSGMHIIKDDKQRSHRSKGPNQVDDAASIIGSPEYMAGPDVDMNMGQQYNEGANAPGGYDGNIEYGSVQ